MSSAAFAVATLIRRMKIEAANLFVIEKTPMCRIGTMCWTPEENGVWAT
jgi:hypothetical protein